ncbi:MAG: type VI secretion system baseplate subunit TssG [Aquincola sp.]|nr:type VI secretion system baseplate subunit TssG [Aquincola sp.]
MAPPDDDTAPRAGVPAGAAPAGEPAPAWPQTLRDASHTPWRHQFLGLLRRLAVHEGQQTGAPPVGLAQRPQQEGHRLGQQASLAFAPRELASVTLEPGLPAQLRLFGLGVLGPNGPLPLHMTERVRERSESRRDDTLAHFIDLFHHRYFSHFYRAWAQAQSAAGLDRANDETFTRYIARLAGDEPAEVQGSALAPHARWAASAHRIRSARDPDGLVSSLSRYFGVPVRLCEFQLHWVPLDTVDQTQLDHPRASGVLGQGAVAGEFIPDRQSRFRLQIGPLDLPGYLRLTPEGEGNGQDLPALVELVRSFIGLEYEWEVELLLLADSAPPCVLGDGALLGCSSWMGKDERHGRQHVTGLVMQPERCLRQARQAAA